MPALILKPGREKSLLRRHPWVFSGAVARVEGVAGPPPADGETVEVRAAGGEFLAWAAYSSRSQIVARAWSFNREDEIGPAFLRGRLEQAIAMRRTLAPAQETDAVRLVHGESDGLPGLVVDRYADTVVVQLLSSGPERWRETLADLLMGLTRAASLYERSDADVRKLEGLPPRVGRLRGEEPPERIAIREGELRFQVDVRRGHKTGYYLDQRFNRRRVAGLAGGRQVLDCFAYTGGFTLSALAGGAETVLAVDSSAEALGLARQHVALNGLPGERVDWLEGDVFAVLRTLRDAARSFDLIVLDPPKFAPTAAQAEKAARGYKDINLLALKLLRPGGLLVTFSCSGGVSEDLFQKIVAGAALDAGVEARIVDRLHQGPDHPVGLSFPEGAYLKGLILVKS